MHEVVNRRSARLMLLPVHVLIKIDNFITFERVRNYSLIFCSLGTVMLLVNSLVRITDPGTTGAFQPDYLAHWTGGRMLSLEQLSSLYSPDAQHQIQNSVLGQTLALSWFVSPPVTAALYFPLAMLGYNPSALIWLVINLILTVWCLRRMMRIAPRLFIRYRWAVALPILASAPLFELLGGGQDTAFMLALWLLGLECLESRHELSSGLLFALGTLKPQNIILVPFALFIQRRFKALAAFIAASAMILLASFLLVGVEGVSTWVKTITGPLYTEQVQQVQLWKMISIPAFALAVLPPGWAVWLAPNLGWISVTAGILVLLWVRYVTRGRTADVKALWMATLATTVVLSPHALLYDGLLLVPVALFLLERRSSRYLRVTLSAAFVATWLTPFSLMLTSLFPWPLAILGAPWSALPLSALWIASIREALGYRAPLKASRPSLMLETGPVNSNRD
ncbi:glycosyltransferase family 87 protein [Arthrobacter sp. SDTb3-6]|uniref:glycosyltransferase family 87 protein n=1 Tax=Arthrobacter sp. SDTb3-6 TaxID=2713571 RepID=UPI00159D8C78|nr:glycosyltransferase family 87 protein [Arthrobacter sp. SDTb3-6]NVM99301.1 DUF2029 domain-containing protein [Arthrobacter sp. SDTb3-6]